jgi:hypothetical protein
MENNRKNPLFSVVLTVLLVSGTLVKAQKVELSPFIGYNTGAKAFTNLGSLHFSNGMELGILADIGLGRGHYAEISYNHVGSYLDLNGSLNDLRICNLSVHYISLGVLQEIWPDTKATPYGLLTIGLVNYHPTTGDYLSENKMFVSLGGGFKVYTSKRIGLRLQARLLLPYFNSGTYFINGIGGTGYDIEGGFRAVRGDITAAVVIFLN